MASPSRLGLDELHGNSETVSIENSADTLEPTVINPPISPQTPHSSPNPSDGLFPSTPIFAGDTSRASDLLFSVSANAEINKARIHDLAVTAVGELTQMAIAQEPIWYQDMDTGRWVLNEVAYKEKFALLDSTLQEVIKMCTLDILYDLPKPLQTEASREGGHVFMDPVSLVKMFVDVDKWSTVFANIVARATVLGVLSTGQPGNPNGALQVMRAEYHLPSPLVRCRESYFARYCKQLASESWIVVDVSVGSIISTPSATCEKRASGCLIQGLKNGYSLVTWVENLAVEDISVRPIFKTLMSSGFAFGAKRWLATLEWQCSRCATLMDKNVADLRDGRRSLLNLSDRMMRDYFNSVSPTPVNPWRPLSIIGAEDIMVMAIENVDCPGYPPGVAIVATTTICLPVLPYKVFRFLQDGNARNKWDVLSRGNVTRERVRVETGGSPRNCVSILEVDDVRQNMKIFYLQESYTNSTGSYVVYAPMDVEAMKMILAGGDPDTVQILASGFAILPDRPTEYREEIGGTLLTISFQILDARSFEVEYCIPPQGIQRLHSLVDDTASMITCALMGWPW